MMKAALDKHIEDTSVLLITLDSCRWDTFSAANTPCFDSLGHFVRAYSQGTYTYPSHMSIYSGILPDTREPIPLLNRFKKNLFRIGSRPTPTPVQSYIEFPIGTTSIIKGFEAMGYTTFGCGALDWFKHPNLSSPFQEFLYTGIDVVSQVHFLEAKLHGTQSEFFAFANIGEPHEPYEFGGLIVPPLTSRTLMREFKDLGFLTEEFDKQVAAIEFVDAQFGRLLESVAKVSDRTLVIVCGDHGECFGEDGLYGHGFYHPKVMEVPLGIFII
jgi:hypothetical protein